MMQTPVQFIVAFVIVLALIGIVTWLIRRFAGNRLGTSTARGRMPRLAVIDAAAVDGRRRLVLVRRDNVEHLLMIGGPSDIVVESNILRAQRDPAASRNLGGELPPRSTPLPDLEVAEAEFEPEAAEPAAPELPRAPRPHFPEEPRRSAAAAPERRPVDPLANFAPEPMTRPEPRPTEPRIEPRPAARAEAPTRPPLPREAQMSRPLLRPEPIQKPTERAEPAISAPPPPPSPTPEENLAEMAQRLEAALRRPPAPAPSRVPSPGPLEASTIPPQPLRGPAPGPAAGRSSAPDSGVIGGPSARSPKGAFENLEDEMASLLGRPKSSS